MKEAKEIKEVNEVKEKSLGVAAFFDLDGTLLPLPSLERRFFRMLGRQGEIPLRNYLLWLAEALRPLPRGLHAIVHANKMYLRGVRVFKESDAGKLAEFSAHESGRPSQFPSKLGASRASQAGGQESAPPSTTERRNPRCPVHHFFEEALERLAWHAKQGHVIAIVSGTLEPLAIAAAQALEGELAARGVDTEIRVCATGLEELGGRFTGRVLGDAVFGAAKACAAHQLAEELRIDLSQSFAYGDSAHDRWLLASVGNAFAVNPSRELLRIAKKRDWQVLRWNQEEELTQRTKSSQRWQSRRSETGKSAGESLLPEHSRTFGKQFRSVEPCT